MFDSSVCSFAPSLSATGFVNRASIYRAARMPEHQIIQILAKRCQLIRLPPVKRLSEGGFNQAL